MEHALTWHELSKEKAVTVPAVTRLGLWTWSHEEYLCFKCLSVSITKHWHWPKGSLAMASGTLVLCNTAHKCLIFTKTLGFSVRTTGSWYAEKVTLEMVL